MLYRTALWLYLLILIFSSFCKELLVTYHDTNLQQTSEVSKACDSIIDPLLSIVLR